jgi:hypothetical protein
MIDKINLYLISEKEKTSLLEYLEESLIAESSIISSLEEYLYNIAKDKQFKKYLEKALIEIEEGAEIYTVLEEYRFITKFEKLVLKMSLEAKEGLSRILSRREINANIYLPFIKGVKNYLYIPGIFFMIYFGNEGFLGIANQMGGLNNITPKIPYLIENPEVSLYLGMGSLSLIIIILLLSFYTYYFKLHWHYKFNKFFELNDGLNIMKSLNDLIQSGLNLQESFYQNAKVYQHPELKHLLEDISQSIKEGEVKMGYFFEEYGFSFEIYNRFKKIEVSGKSEIVLEKIIKGLEKRRNNYIKKFEEEFPSRTFFFSIAVIAYPIYEILMMIIDSGLGV